MDAEFIVSIGLNDKDTHEQEIGTGKAKSIVFGAFGDCTIQTCDGSFTHENGVKVYEKSFRFFVYDDHANAPKIAKICRELKVKLNQESIVMSWRPCGETAFI